MKLTDKLKTRNVVMPWEAQPSSVSVGSLDQVIADLGLLNHRTEQDFLSIGGKLTEFMQAVKVISSELSSLANSEQGQRASHALTLALDRATAKRAALGESDTGLAGMRNEISLLKRTLSGFVGTVSNFNTLALLTRVETARLGSAGTGFSQVADDVRLLAGKVHSSVERALAIADSLIQPIEDAMREISALDAAQARDLPTMISRTLASLSSFRDAQDSAHESSIRLGDQYGAISDSFKKLIVSIQFHDITRQQIEHVLEVLQRLSSENGAKDGSTSRQLRGVSAVLALQSAQLSDAGQKFASSVVSVERSLEEIARHVLAMVHQSRALAGLSEDDNGSIFLPIEEDCGAILTGLGHSADVESAIRVARNRLQETVSKMLEPIAEIKKIQLQIRMVALNARISAFHLGSSGSTLDALAGSVQQLAAECGARSELLDPMSKAVTRWRWECGSDLVGEGAKGDGLVDELRLAVEDLHTSTEGSFALIHQVVARGECLAGELAATRESFSVGSLFAEAIARVRRTMNEIAETTRSGLQRDECDESEADLADFVSHYTMQAEREVHEGITRTAAGATHVAVPAERQNFPPGEADELGDNVEFF